MLESHNQPAVARPARIVPMVVSPMQYPPCSAPSVVREPTHHSIARYACRVHLADTNPHRVELHVMHALLVNIPISSVRPHACHALSVKLHRRQNPPSVRPVPLVASPLRLDRLYVHSVRKDCTNLLMASPVVCNVELVHSPLIPLSSSIRSFRFCRINSMKMVL